MLLRYLFYRSRYNFNQVLIEANMPVVTFIQKRTDSIQDVVSCTVKGMHGQVSVMWAIFMGNDEQLNLGHGIAPIPIDGLGKRVR